MDKLILVGGPDGDEVVAAAYTRAPGRHWNGVTYQDQVADTKYGDLDVLEAIDGTRPHLINFAGGPAGGFWIRESDLAYILRQDDSFVYSNFDGFPAQSLDYLLI